MCYVKCSINLYMATLCYLKVNSVTLEIELTIIDEITRILIYNDWCTIYFPLVSKSVMCSIFDGDKTPAEVIDTFWISTLISDLSVRDFWLLRRYRKSLVLNSQSN